MPRSVPRGSEGQAGGIRGNFLLDDSNLCQTSFRCMAIVGVSLRPRLPQKSAPRDSARRAQALVVNRQSWTHEVTTTGSHASQAPLMVSVPTMLSSAELTKQLAQLSARYVLSQEHQAQWHDRISAAQVRRHGAVVTE